MLVQISTEAEGKPWSIEKSPARNYIPNVVSAGLKTSKTFPKLDDGASSGSKMASSGSFNSNDTSLEDFYGMSKSVLGSFGF